ncbi:MAG TPA: hypothetical protein C5S37_12195 [Methanophagales archaeon]|nr:hypothetical protein [Methanophagales archaeon]
MVKTNELPPPIEVNSKDLQSIEDLEYGKHYRIKGGLQVESNLSELMEEIELNTKIQIVGREVEIPVGKSIYEKLKGKKIKFVTKQ